MRIFLACALTLCVEVPFLWLAGFRSREEIAVAACANVVTNLSLNLLLWRFPALYGPPTVALLEALVVAAEWGIYRLALGRRRGLLWLTLAANALSFVTGLLVF